MQNESFEWLQIRQAVAVKGDVSLQKILLFLTFAILLVPGQSGFGTVDSGVTASSTAFSSQRKLVRDSSGNLFVVYLKPVENLSEVFLSKSTDNGATWREVGQVSGGKFESVRASIAIDAKDQIYVFWTKFIGEYGQISYRVYDKNGWSDEHQLTSGDAYSGYPSACFDSKGHIHLVWYGFDGTAYQVFYTSFDGTQWSTPIKLSQGYPDSVNPTVAIDPSGNIHVAWFKSNGRRYQINYIEWSGSWSSQVALSSPSADAYNPSLAIDSKGTVFVVWDEGQGPITQIYYSMHSGSGWSHETPITIGPSAQNPSIAIDRQDNVYVAYDKSDGQIYLRKFDSAWSPEEEITSLGVNTYPTLRWSFLNNPYSEAGGKVDLAWTSKEDGISKVKYAAFNITAVTSEHITQGLEGNLPTIDARTFSMIAAAGLFALVLVYAYSRTRKPE